MKRNVLLCLLFITMLALGLWGCSSPPQAESAEAAVAEVTTDDVEESSANHAVSEDAEAEENTTSAEEENDNEAEAVVEEVDYCIECHNDQAMLTDTAAPEVDLEGESEGEG